MQEVKAPIIGIDRHRLTTDGEGVTTLVAFHGCPLHCKYCLNPQCLSPDGVLRTITPSELYSEVEIDDLYFVATGGGICFGGGEPLLHSKFIEEFVKIMKSRVVHHIGNIVERAFEAAGNGCTAYKRVLLLM